MKIKGQVAIVTGSGHGIGKGIALVLAKEGTKLVVNDTGRTDRAKRVAEEIRSMGSEAIAVPADVSNSDDVKKLVDKTLDEFGTIDILVNNAGIQLGRGIPHAQWPDVSEETWDRVMDINLKGMFLCSRAVSPTMLKNKKGNIVNISSIMAWAGRGDICYITSKAGIIGLTRALALALAPHIRVNAIAPGSITSFPIKDPATREFILLETPLHRRGTPEEIGRVALFLVSEDSSFITGETIVVGGGRYRDTFRGPPPRFYYPVTGLR